MRLLLYRETTVEARVDCICSTAEHGSLSVGTVLENSMFYSLVCSVLRCPCCLMRGSGPVMMSSCTPSLCITCMVLLMHCCVHLQWGLQLSWQPDLILIRYNRTSKGRGCLSCG